MKHFLILPLYISFLAFTPFLKKQMIGNWTTETTLYGLNVGDTVSFTKIPYSYNLYTWGKHPAGIEFKENNEFAEYFNVMCSTESDEKRFTGEKWDLQNGDIILVTSDNRDVSFKILSLTKKHLKLKCLNYKNKNG